MLSALHEVLLELFRNRPALAAELLRDTLELDLPAYQHARLDPADLTDIVPTEFRADAVVVHRNAEQPVLAIIVEVQLDPDPGKRWSWPAYVGTLRSRLQCPTELLVICPKPATARWCTTPIPLGIAGSALIPLVLGPDRIPIVTRLADTADRPELAVLSALAHGAGPDAEQVVDVLADALATIEKRQATLYLGLVLAALPHAARAHLEEIMKTGTYEYQSEFTEQLRNEGRVEGRVESTATAVLTVLDAAGIEIADTARARISSCPDLDRLELWLRRAVTATSVDDLFA